MVLVFTEETKSAETDHYRGSYIHEDPKEFVIY